MYTIQNDIPLPTGEPAKKGRAAIYPFEALAVGESFFVDGKVSKDIKPSARHFSNRLDRKFKYETRTEDGIRGVRVWRVE